MEAKLVSQNDWIFTDSKLSDFTAVETLSTAFATRCGVQLFVTDTIGDISLSVTSAGGWNLKIGEMKAVGVDKNTAPKLMTTKTMKNAALM